MQHRRTDRRYDRRVPIDVTHDGATFTTETINISLGGVFVACNRALPFGARVKLRFRVPTQSEYIEAEGDIRWAESEEGTVRGVGIRFDGLRAKDVWALNKYFEKPVDT
jgi:uncharacterized protein (TIGR02266 family)